VKRRLQRPNVNGPIYYGYKDNVKDALIGETPVRPRPSNQHA
jgi:hypothetical protein